MASPQASEKIFANNKIEMFWKDGSYDTIATISEWVDMKDYGNFAVIMTAGNLSGAGVKALSIYADNDSAGNGTPTAIKAWSGDVGTAEGDYLVLEVSAEEIRQEAEDAGVDFRYVCAYITLANVGDEAAITYIRSNPVFPQTGLTADSVT